MSIYTLIPLLPLLAFLTLALSGRRLAGASHKVGVPAVGLSAALSIYAFYTVATSGPISISLYRFIDVGALTIDVDLYIDQLTVLLLLLVAGGSFVVHVYSSSYMIGDPRYRRFFAVMALFTFAMIMLVMSNNLLITYMCWEVMGICSYLLISHWAHREAAAKAATKAFLVNAVADVGLGFGVILTFATYGTLNIQEILAAAASVEAGDINLLAWLGWEWMVERNTLITFCLLSGALGKSAQFPLHVWLPFAMEAPTPISALIHAATMVNAGPFLLARMSPLVLLAPTAMTVIAIVGAVTALFGGLVSLTQSDIKKLLAYSTISQIGFMIFACGVGAFVAAIFHLLAHGFLKGFLFLSTGEALTATGHGHAEGHAESDRRVDPSLALGALLLTLVPVFVLFAGPYEQMWSVHQVPSARIAFWIVALSTVFLTATYTFRAIVSLFQRDIALGVRAGLYSAPYFPGLGATAILVGCLLVFGWSSFAAFLAPALGAHPAGFDGPFLSPWLLAPVLTALAGWGSAYYFHLSGGLAVAGGGEWKKTAYVFLLNKLYVDEIYEVYVVKPVVRICEWLWRVVDVRVVDGLVRGVGALSGHLADWLRWVVEARGLDGPIRGIARSTLRLSSFLWRAVEVRALDRQLERGASSSVSLSRWLWEIVDLRGTDKTVERLGQLSEDTGEILQRSEPRTLQHHLVVVVFWLVLAIALSYWLAR